MTAEGKDLAPPRAQHNHPTPTFDRKPEGECPRCDELTDQENAIVRWTPRPTRGLFG